MRGDAKLPLLRLLLLLAAAAAAGCWLLAAGWCCCCYWLLLLLLCYARYAWGNGEEIHVHDGTALALAPGDVLGKGYPVKLASPGQNLIALTLRDLCYHGTSGDYTVL